MSGGESGGRRECARSRARGKGGGGSRVVEGGGAPKGERGAGTRWEGVGGGTPRGGGRGVRAVAWPTTARRRYNAH